VKLRIRLISNTDPEHDPLREARGMVTGIAVSLVFWAGFWILYLLAR